MGSLIVAVVALLVAVGMVGAGVWWARSLWRHRLDRDPHHTVVRALGVSGLLAGALFSVAIAFEQLGLPAAVVNTIVNASLILFLVTLLAVVITSAVIELQQARDRRAARRSAVQLGEKVPRSLYRRRPRSPGVIVALYFGASAVGLLALILILVLLKAPSEWWWTPVSVWTGGPPVELPRLLVPFMVMLGVGMLHAFVNDVRRDRQLLGGRRRDSAS